MEEYYHIHKKEDFDLYFDDLAPKWIWPAFLKAEIGRILAFLYVIRNASVIHLCFLGGPLGTTWLRGIEGHLYRWAGIRTVVLPYGGDMYMYSRIMDPCVRHGLLLSYPQMAAREKEVEKRVHYWVRHADAIVMGFNIDGVGRWDVLVGNMICIDLNDWQKRISYSTTDGHNGVVKVLHAPNHRGVKGSEFLFRAVEELIAEGLQIELILLEKVPNDRIRSVMQEVDVLADQFILPGYGLSAVEGMASGLPVLANLDDEVYMKLFRRYSFLNECPILSTTPESLKCNLRSLVIDPKLRECLGRASRDYAEKYHSYETAGYLFGSIYDKLLNGKKVDLPNIFHPLISEYVQKSPVRHPLLQSRLPSLPR
jgi:glycosyltransferase involved in cell wall biosynthesis